MPTQINILYVYISNVDTFKIGDDARCALWYYVFIVYVNINIKNTWEVLQTPNCNAALSANTRRVY